MGELTVNGRRHVVDAEDDTPLLYVLRNHLGLKAMPLTLASSQVNAYLVGSGCGSDDLDCVK